MIYNQLDLNLINPDNPMIQTNTPARMRTNVLYAVAAAVGGRVCCTSNRSEGYVGYTTKWGDSVGDFSPLRAFTVSEVLELGSLMNLPLHFIFKEPSDGMSGKTDEENLGFSYEDVDLCIQGLPGLVDYEKRELIKNRHFYSSHKREKIPCCPHYNKAV
jgi:NAD+ synthase